MSHACYKMTYTVKFTLDNKLIAFFIIMFFIDVSKEKCSLKLSRKNEYDQTRAAASLLPFIKCVKKILLIVVMQSIINEAPTRTMGY